MVHVPTPSGPAFRALERAWLRRAAARIEPILWLEIGAIALLAGGFLFWRVHIALASLAHDRGLAAAAVQLTALLAALALLGAALAGTRHAVQLRRTRGAPPWLALPLSDAALARHLAAISCLHARWLVVPAAALLVAAAGVLPAWSLPPLALAFVAALEWVSRSACALALWFTAAAAPAPGLSTVVRALASAGRDALQRRLPAARWGRARTWVALAWNDVRLTRRAPAVRRRALTALAAAALSLAAWRLPAAPALAHFGAFALSMVAAATFAEWLIAVIGTDPPDVLRALPVGLPSAWGARMAWAVLGSLALVAGHALVARGVVDAAALRFFLIWIGLASLAVTTLGVHYGLSLYPRADQAQRILSLTLGLAIAASLMVPLMGWIVLLTAVLHSLRRVARWRNAEVR